MMKRICIILLAAFMPLVSKAMGQIDSTMVAPAAPSVTVDSTLVGHGIFEVMPSRFKGSRGNVTIRQSAAIRRAVTSKAENATLGQIPGYRVRIYFSNAQNAREESAAAAARFAAKFGTHSVYHSFVNPNFKVTVGDFRTKSEALALLNQVKKDFPSAFVVKEQINPKY